MDNSTLALSVLVKAASLGLSLILQQSGRKLLGPELIKAFTAEDHGPRVFVGPYLHEPDL